jgi:S-adenosylmethionine uptake transporter
MILIAARLGLLRLPTLPKDRRLIAVRTLAEVVAAWFFLTALFNMPFANVTAILQAAPLAVALAAAVVLKEPVGWRRMVAIGIGFAGVMLIVRPGADGFTIYSIYVLLAVAAVVARDLATRRMSRDVPSFFVALSGAVGVTLFGGVGSLFVDWTPIDGRDLLLLAGSVVFIVAAYLFSVMVMRVGEIGFVAPFRYTSLVIALVIGWAVFAEWPDTLTLIGAGVVVATGLFTIWREQVQARRRRTAPAQSGRMRTDQISPRI